jgi:signal transduction histidine kinase
VAAATPSRDDGTSVEAIVGRDVRGTEVLSAHAAITPLNWSVFVDLPIAEAFAPLYASILRTVVLVLVGVVISILASLFLVRRMVSPIQALRVGAARIGSGALEHRIDVKSGDELQALAEEFNRMTERLQESYAGLERKVEERTRDLRESLEQQTATSEILRVISSSPTDLDPVFRMILEKAAHLAETDLGVLWLHEGNGLMSCVATHGTSADYAQWIMANPQRFQKPFYRPEPPWRPGQFLDVRETAAYREGDPFWVRTCDLEGIRTVLSVPLVAKGRLVGSFGVTRREVRGFSEKHIALVETFADQAVIAIENTRLFKELQARTAELGRSVEELKALGEVGAAVSSTLDLDTVLTTILTHANQLAGTEAGLISDYDEVTEELRPLAANGFYESIADVLRRNPFRKGEGVAGQAVAKRQPVQVSDIAIEGAYESRIRDLLIESGFRAVLAVPLIREDQVMGTLVVTRKQPGEFSRQVVDLLSTFASQSALAIQNARLFLEIEQKSHELQIASQHKSQFLANMSHELRTPLNAILGYTELIVDQIYGKVPEKIRDVLERVQKSGRHLLGLINDVLDLSKIEAGQLTLSLSDYSFQDALQSVVASIESLARGKGLQLSVEVAPKLPVGRADERRIVQVLLNLAGNAIKFTDAGEVKIRVNAVDDTFVVAVSDTGPGIPETQHERIFEEFQQVDGSSTRAKGGTGLGLAIAKKIIELHGGRIRVESVVGKGSTFTFSLPVRTEIREVVQ